MIDNSACILIACHKECRLPKQDFFLPVQVGSAHSIVDLKMQRDDQGENISSKNKSYCELTAMYWAWKNLQNIEIIGLSHYRRFFDFNNQCRPLLPQTSFYYDEIASLNFSPDKHTVNQVVMGGG